jgi:hypothetical protein
MARGIVPEKVTYNPEERPRYFWRYLYTRAEPKPTSEKIQIHVRRTIANPNR